MIQILDGVFHLTNGRFSYAFTVRGGKLVHTYFGRALGIDSSTVRDSVAARGASNVGCDGIGYELPERGRGDFRVPAVVLNDGKTTATDFTFVGYEILDKKPAFGMPALRDGGETLKVVLRDTVIGAEIALYYTVFEAGLARRAEIVNTGKSPLGLKKLMSSCVEFPTGDRDLIDLNGRWGSEFGVTRAAAASGIKEFCSMRGVSSHQHNPFVAVADKTTCEDYGDAYGFNLIFSGDFKIECDTDENNGLRVNIGAEIGDGITLAAGETFRTPEAVIVYSCDGLGGMSRAFHRLYRKHLIDPRFADKRRPVVLNSWESMFFDLDEKKFLDFVDCAKGMGIDTIVLDDGWFGKRDDDTSSLGDWVVDKNKFPHGLGGAIERCKKYGMEFGIWFEPEAISPRSELFKAHPDYAIGSDARERVQMRNQYMLDFSRREVVDCIFEQMSKILSEYDISYVKWDMNRSIADASNARQCYEYVLGVYDLYERLTAAFPKVLIEGCSSGGGRFDPAILYYSPLIWTSDDSDAYERAFIQYGASMCYPLQTLSNHVSACPNHQVGRVTPLVTRGAVASLGALGYELDFAKLNGEELATIKKQIASYKKDAELILTGELYRLKSPFDGGIFCEEVVAEDKSRAYAVAVRGLNKCNLRMPRIKLKGLDERAVYKVVEKDLTVTGGDLMYGGLDFDLYCKDFACDSVHIEKADK